MRRFHARHRSAAALAGLSLAAALALTGCGAGGQASSGSAAAGPRQDAAGAPAEAAKPGAAKPGAAAPPAADGKGSPQAPAAVRPHVIRTGSLAVETADPQKTLAAARTAAEGAGGYVGDESTERGSDGRMTSTLTLRVPGERFDAVIAALEGGGKLLRRKVAAQDVTEKVADVDSRVKSQQASVARVREMMEKASALGDVVMLEGELSRRQSDLESLLAQQNALKDQTAMGTVTLSVSEPAAPRAARDDEDGGPSLGDALGAGWSVFTTLVRYLALAVAVALPFALAAALAVLGFRGYRRLRPARPKARPAVVPAPREAPAAAGSAPAGADPAR
ncbi:DUF4349 domain-containing protein [Streptomyces sp. NPDC029003]|uniref:DUF4349 domain-containing protein n=1 Tax=Streptomyces sp. NPDC029003 TaxID=3155125 RepID=UPI0033D3D27D